MEDGELDHAIIAEQENNSRLRREIAESDAKLQILREARRVMRGELPRGLPKSRLSIPDAAEQILQEGEKHVDEIVRRLQEDFSIRAQKGTVTTSLMRYAQKGRRFKHLKKNYFALLKEGEQ